MILLASLSTATALLFRFPDILAAFKKMTTNEDTDTDTEACLVVSKSAFFYSLEGSH